MDYRNIIVEKRDRIVCVTLNRPEAMNAFTPAMTIELVHVLTEYRDDPEQWAMIITGAGDRAFSTGMDVKEGASRADKENRTIQTSSMKPVVDLLQSIHKPFISAVNGYCLGGGWHLMCDSDIVIGSENAIFMDTHVNLGIINGVESVGLAYKMPLGIVLRMVVEGRHFRVNAQQAYQWGLLSEVVPLHQLMPRAWEIAYHIVEESAPLAVQGSKKAILGAIDRGYHDGVLWGWSVLPEIRGTQDVQEGPRAFVEKRKPRFIGR